MPHYLNQYNQSIDRLHSLVDIAGQLEMNTATLMVDLFLKRKTTFLLGEGLIDCSLGSLSIIKVF